MMLSSRRVLVGGLFAVLLVALDQYSKYFFRQILPQYPGYVMNINGLLDFVHSWNYGISWGLFDSYGSSSNMALMVINALVVLCLLYIYFSDKTASISYLWIAGGGIGNLFDRWFHGAVFDFISLHYMEYYFPAFNLADAFISLGAAVFIYNAITDKP